MDIDQKQIISQFTQLEHLPSGLNPEEEAEHIRQLVHGPLTEPLQLYQEARIEGAGGSGIVLSAIFKPFGNRRAIKVPRKRVFEDASGEAVKEDPELHALSKVSHQNITRLYDSFSLGEGHGYCMITEYVGNAQSLDRYAAKICCTQLCLDSNFELSKSLRVVAGLVFDVVDALKYMHTQASLLHFDVKPDNILVSETGHPYVTDLGFARDITKYQDQDGVKVGFTWKYAHPDLVNPNEGARVTQTPAKAKNTIKAANLRFQYDIFAFGRTLQETLYGIEEEYGESIHSDYTFNFLHIVACLCLDGRNASNGRNGGQRSFVTDIAFGMPTALFATYRFANMGDVQTALERLLGRRRLEDELPELDRWSSSTVKVSDLGTTAFTPRVKAVLGHPAVARLSAESQLGMLDTVFPTATHSRLQHSLGVFHAVGQYLSALYYDPENPTFRIILSPPEARRVLLAAIVHDLGSTTFGHELEELHDKFKHTVIAHTLLHDSNIKDEQGRTLADVIESDAFDGWDVQVNDIIQLLSGVKSEPLDYVLFDILNGPLDADKLDYLFRDSVECRVPYGQAIDCDRFLRSLTTCTRSSGRTAQLRLAVRRKGAASAEAFALARYQLYQALYWHHTFRAIKAMLFTAAGYAMDSIRKKATKSLFDEGAFVDAYVNYAILQRIVGSPGLVSDDSKRKGRPKGSGETITDMLYNLLGSPDEPSGPNKYAQDRTICFFWKMADERERLLLKDIVNRNYYKRAYEIPLTGLPEHGWLKLRDMMKGEARLSFQTEISQSLMNALVSTIQDKMTVRESLVRDKVLERVQGIERSKHVFVVDLPVRGWSAGGNEPLFVSDYKRRYFRATAGADDGDGGRTIWTEHLEKMMRSIAFFRVFCEPELHRILTRVLTPEDVQDAVNEVLTGITTN